MAKRELLRLALSLVWCLTALSIGCTRTFHSTIAFIPQIVADDLWEAARVGSRDATVKTGYSIYWNGPTTDNDIETQIALLKDVIAREPAGIILSADNTLALMSPMQMAASRGIPIVIVGSLLSFASSGNVFYVLNDEEKEGRIAARRIGERLHGKGSVAIIGLNLAEGGQYSRLRSFELTLNHDFPGIAIISREMGTYSDAQEEQTARRLLSGGHVPDAILGLTQRSTEAAVRALEQRNAGNHIILVGCDQNYALLSYLSHGKMDSIVAENTYAMGYQAAKLILSVNTVKSASNTVRIDPILITSENMNSPQFRSVLTHDVRLRP